VDLGKATSDISAKGILPGLFVGDIALIMLFVSTDMPVSFDGNEVRLCTLLRKPFITRIVDDR
jgi:hypothetical protein